jgi:hypothetical protein
MLSFLTEEIKETAKDTRIERKREIERTIEFLH